MSRFCPAKKHHYLRGSHRLPFGPEQTLGVKFRSGRNIGYDVFADSDLPQACMPNAVRFAVPAGSTSHAALAAAVSSSAAAAAAALALETRRSSVEFGGAVRTCKSARPMALLPARP